ncbi:Beta-amylase [Psidium guajava]|nr:Beta-amylase [Psidium guajava]
MELTLELCPELGHHGFGAHARALFQAHHGCDVKLRATSSLTIIWAITEVGPSPTSDLVLTSVATALKLGSQA